MPMEEEVKKHNQRVFKSLEEGDIIRFIREIYDHYGIYIGKGNVVHDGKDEKGNVIVKEEDFFTVCKNSKAEKDNYLDDKRRPFDGKVTVARARSQIGKSGYNLLTNNCEHFATWCRNGIKFSKQVMTGITWFAFSLLFIIIVVFTFIFRGPFALNRSNSKKGKKNYGQDLFDLSLPYRLLMSPY